MFLSLHFSIFCFEISGLDLFYLSTLCECCLSVLAESGGSRIILLLQYLIFVSKNPKIFAYLHHYALHFCILHGTCTRFCFEVLVRISYRNDYTYHLNKKFAFHVVAYPFFIGHNAFALIVRCAFCFMWRCNTISCTAIYLF